MKNEDVKIGLRVQVGKLWEMEIDRLHPFDKRLVENREAGIIGTVEAGTTYSFTDEGWNDCIWRVSAQRHRDGKIIQALYYSSELEIAVQLPFDPPPFNNSLMRWLDTSGEFND